MNNILVFQEYYVVPRVIGVYVLDVYTCEIFSFGARQFRID